MHVEKSSLCSPGVRTVRLELTSNQIKGTIPSELAQLSNLVLLGLGQNQVSGRIPGILGELKQLCEY